MHVCYGWGSNFSVKCDISPNNIIIKHVDRRIRGKADTGNLLFNAYFTAAYNYPIRSHKTKKKTLFSGNIHVKAELLDKHGNKIQLIVFVNGITLNLSETVRYHYSYFYI